MNSTFVIIINFFKFIIIIYCLSFISLLLFLLLLLTSRFYPVMPGTVKISFTE